MFNTDSIDYAVKTKVNDIRTESLEALMYTMVSKFNLCPHGVDKQEVLQFQYDILHYAKNEIVARVAELLKEKRQSKDFATRIFSSYPSVSVTSGKMVAYDHDKTPTSIVPILGMFTEKKEEEAVRGTVAVISACLTINKPKFSGPDVSFEYTDAKRKFYPTADVLLTGQISMLLTQKALKVKNVPDLRRVMVKNVMDLKSKSSWMRDLIANIVSDSGANMSHSHLVRITRPTTEQHADYHRNLGKSVLPGIYGQAARPKAPPLSANPNIDKIYEMIEVHRKVRGSDDKGISYLTHGYLLGEMGDLTRPIQGCMDIMQIMSRFNCTSVVITSHKYFKRTWPLLDEQVVVVDSNVIEDCPKTAKKGRFRQAPAHKKLTIGFGLEKPSVAGTKVNFTSTVNDAVMPRVNAGQVVLTYAHADLWEKSRNLVVFPSVHAHAGLVWVASRAKVKVTGDSFPIEMFCARTTHANNFKTMFPFHRRLFAPLDEFIKYPTVTVRRKIKALNILVDEIELEADDRLLDDYYDPIPELVDEEAPKRNIAAEFFNIDAVDYQPAQPGGENLAPAGQRVDNEVVPPADDFGLV